MASIRAVFLCVCGVMHAVAGGIVADLQQLAELREKGNLDDEQYERAVARALDEQALEDAMVSRVLARVDHGDRTGGLDTVDSWQEDRRLQTSTGSRCIYRYSTTYCCVVGQTTYGDGSACRGGERANCAFYGNAGMPKCVYEGPPAEHAGAYGSCPCGMFLVGDKSACTFQFPQTTSTSCALIGNTGMPRCSGFACPTAKPTTSPTESPSEAPTDTPTETPTRSPTEAPTQSVANRVASANIWLQHEDGKVVFGPKADVSLRRHGANMLRTDGDFVVGGLLRTGGGGTDLAASLTHLATRLTKLESYNTPTCEILRYLAGACRGDIASGSAYLARAAATETCSEACIHRYCGREKASQPSGCGATETDTHASWEAKGGSFEWPHKPDSSPAFCRRGVAYENDIQACHWVHPRSDPKSPCVKGYSFNGNYIYSARRDSA